MSRLLTWLVLFLEAVERCLQRPTAMPAGEHSIAHDLINNPTPTRRS